MNNSWKGRAIDGEPVAAEDIASAVVAGPLRYDDGARQVFRPDGSTTYTEHGHETRGKWQPAVDGDRVVCQGVSEVPGLPGDHRGRSTAGGQPFQRVRRDLVLGRRP